MGSLSATGRPEKWRKLAPATSLLFAAIAIPYSALPDTNASPQAAAPDEAVSRTLVYVALAAGVPVPAGYLNEQTAARFTPTFY